MLAWFGLFLVPMGLLLRDPTQRAASGWLGSPMKESAPARLLVERETLTLEIGEKRQQMARTWLVTGFVQPMTKERSALVLRFRDGRVWTMHDLPLARCEVRHDTRLHG